ncbi:MAG: hypothetical protein ACOCZS_04115 [Verrucomicrobiota bacterium]
MSTEFRDDCIAVACLELVGPAPQFPVDHADQFCQVRALLHILNGFLDGAFHFPLQTFKATS